MAAPRHNQNARKFATKKARQALFQKWVAHRESGFSKDTFSPCDYRTIQRYAVDFPEDFPPDEMSRAERACEHHWEKILMAACLGEIKTPPALIIFQMTNRFPEHWKRDPKPENAPAETKFVFGFSPSQFAKVPTDAEVWEKGRDW